MSFPKLLRLNIGDLHLPQYLPDATFGQVRNLSASAVEACGIEAMMMNTFHLMQKPGASTVKSLGGLQQMSGWKKAIFTDSGGFQAYSLMRQNVKFGSLNNNGISYIPEGKKRKFLLTPEKCVQLQVSFGANVVFCLDDCTHIDDSLNEQTISVERTIRWAARCRAEFDRLMKEKRLPKEKQPKLFAVVQGGQSRELRTRCAQELLAIGFDGYGYGGWPLDSESRLVEDMITLLRELIPDEYSIHALGIGHPPFIARCTKIGYGLFDSAMPTRDARHGRLYRFSAMPEPKTMHLTDNWFEYIYVNDKRYIKSKRPIEEGCTCPTCTHYSLGYLRHLFKLNDGLYYQLATQHNLNFMARLMKLLQQVL
ncbi:MAG: queuine tRNA-ribosyltransferase family protein [Anaerolineaceae bacterium]|nr:queuine tRNA-ribosyltransferase family protein [Anaerolineaceae bacterium]